MRTRVIVVGGATFLPALDGEVTAVDVADLVTRDGARTAVEAAVASLGGLDVVVLAALPAEAVDVLPLARVDDARWDAVWERTMRSTVWLLQAAHRHLAAGGGRVVVVVPTVGLSGAPGLAPLAAVAEAQRVLAKSAARQWGPDGITVNCLAVSPVTAGVAPEALGSMALSEPALSDVGIGPVLGFLTSEASASLTGATLTVDGGVWMAP